MSILAPIAYVRDVSCIDPMRLRELGKTAVLLDRDNTIVPRDTRVLTNEAAKWLEDLRSADIAVCLISNNWTQQVHEDASQLGLPVVAKAMKPFPFAFLHALKKLGVTRTSAVVVGDQLYTDVLGAKIAGIDCILVPPLSKKDLPYTYLFRMFERKVLDASTIKDGI